MCKGCVNLQSCVNVPGCVNLWGCVECNELLIANDCILLTGQCLETTVHGRDCEKIPLNLQDCLQTEFAAKQGSY